MRGPRLSIRELPTPTFYNYVIGLQFSSAAVAVDFSLPLSFLLRVLRLTADSSWLPKSATWDRNKENSQCGLSAYIYIV